MTKGYEKSRVKIGWLHYIFICYTRSCKEVFDRKVRRRCEKLILDKLRELNCEKKRLDINRNNILMGVKTNPNQSPNSLISQVKGCTSRVLREEFPEIRKMPSLWTRDYFVSTYGRHSKKDENGYRSSVIRQNGKYRKELRRRNKEARKKAKLQSQATFPKLSKPDYSGAVKTLRELNF